MGIRRGIGVAYGRLPRDMITRAVILAAGRLPTGNGHDTLRPLVLVDGEPLIHRTVRTLRGLGVSDITVVVGYRGDEIRTAVAAMPDVGRPVRVVENPAWRRTSGISLLAAAPHVT